MYNYFGDLFGILNFFSYIFVCFNVINFFCDFGNIFFEFDYLFLNKNDVCL